MSYQPPIYQQQPKRGVSCWLVGGIGCLFIIVLAIVAIVMSINALTKSKVGKSLLGSMSSAVRTTQEAAQCVPAMVAVHDAVVRYHDHNGKYPASLKDLDPKYLPPGTTLHCGVDENTDPTHITYEYFRPTETSPKTDIMLRLTWKVVYQVENQSEVQTFSEVVTVGGQATQGQPVVTMTGPGSSTVPATVPTR